MARGADIYGSGMFMKATIGGAIDMPGNPYEVVGTIAKIETSTFKDQKSGDDKAQRVIHWAEEDLPALGLNKTNWGTICAFTGLEDDDDWIGQKVECFVVPEKMSKTGHSIRVRKPRGGAAATNGNGHAPAVRPMGELAAKKMLAAIEKTPYQLDTLRAVLSENPKREKAAQGDPATWPAEWMADIKAWLDKPRVAKTPGPAYEPVGEDDIPF